MRNKKIKVLLTHGEIKTIPSYDVPITVAIDKHLDQMFIERSKNIADIKMQVNWKKLFKIIKL